MPSTPADAAAIRSLIDTWARAIEARDLDGITGRYTPETVLFDAIPPHRTIGAQAIRKAWADCLPHFPERFTTDLRDVVVEVSGDVAWAHFLLHFTSTPAGHPCGQTWMRATTAYRRERGRWVVAHEHVSIPFNPMTNQAWFIADPAVAEVPDYSQLPGCGGGQGDGR